MTAAGGTVIDQSLQSPMPASTPLISAEANTSSDLVRIGVVSFLNTIPLIDGLDGLRNLEIRQSVPSCLIDQLLSGEVDFALCSSIDYQTSPVELKIVPAGLLGCDGQTLTVRLYSSRPIHTLTNIWCDTDSHTSIILLRILLREMFDIDPELIEYNAREHVADNRPIEWPEATLLIGDKVVTDSPPAVRYPHQLDLGAAWVNLTGRPFVFAAWMTRCDVEEDFIRPVAWALDRQRRANHLHIESLIAAHARQRGWPHDLATVYLREYLTYEWTDERSRGLELFWAKAKEHQLIDSLRPLHLAEFSSASES